MVADEILLNAVIAALAEGGKWQMAGPSAPLLNPKNTARKAIKFRLVQYELEALSVLLDFEQRRLHKTAAQL